MVHRKALEKAGYTDDKLKALFTAEKLNDDIERLVRLNSRRIDDEILRNLREAPVYRAIDIAYDVTPLTVFHTLVRDMVAEGRNATEITAALAGRPEARRLEQMLVPALGSDNEPLRDKEGNSIFRLDLPIFLNVMLPLVASYLTARWATLWAERDRHPLFKYEPLRQSKTNRAKTQILTSIIDRMSNDLGYRADYRAALQQTLKYGRCMMMPTEPYYVEKQQDDSGEDYVVAEGLRWEIPHISRSFIDMAHRHGTANTQTGTEYGGYWTVRRYGEVQADKTLWNVENIKGGYSDDMLALWNWWRMFEPCQLKFPIVGPSTPTDRLTEAFIYTQANEDDAVTLVPFFHRLVPADWGLYDYPHPVWHRFLFAGPNTVVHVAPLTYNPLVVMLYDHDINSVRPRSLGLELMPWQDQLGNLLTQYICNVRANADRIVFWNADIIDQKAIDSLGVNAERRVKGPVYIPYSRDELRWGMQDKSDIYSAFVPPQMNTAEVGQAVSLMLATMERALAFASIEIGGAATHEQSAHEIRVVDRNVGSRRALTSSHIRDAEQAIKKACYEAYVQADVESEFDAVIDNADEDLIEAAKELKFKIEKSETVHGFQVTIRGDREALELDAFASEREGEDRIDDTKIAVAMVQAFQTLFANPAIVQQVGIEQLMSLFNQMLGFVGTPLDFRLKYKPGAVPPEAEPQADAQAQLQALAQGLDAKLQQMVQQVIVPMQEKNNAAQQQIAEAMGQLAKKVLGIAQITAAGAQKDVGQDQAITAIIQQMQKLAAYVTLQSIPPPVRGPVGPAVAVPPPGMGGPPVPVGGQAMPVPV